MVDASCISLCTANFMGHLSSHLLKDEIERVMRARSLMTTEIVSAGEYVEFLKEKYEGFEFPGYKLREWFSKSHQVFFDCAAKDRNVCIVHLLEQTDLEAFTIFFVVREKSGGYRFMDASFRNLGTETLDHFINRYHQQLESMTRLSIQTIGLEYIECIGHGYEEATKTIT